MKNRILTWSRGLWRFCIKHRFVILVILVLGACFYWFEWRPTEIKKECSYVPYKIEAITELTQETIDKEKADFDACVTKNPSPPIKGLFSDIFIDSISAVCSKMPRGYGETPRNASPARIEYREAYPAEYTFCLHSHGL